MRCPWRRLEQRRRGSWHSLRLRAARDVNCALAWCRLCVMPTVRFTSFLSAASVVASALMVPFAALALTALLSFACLVTSLVMCSA